MRLLLVLLLFIIITAGCQASNNPSKKASHPTSQQTSGNNSGGIVAGSVVPNLMMEQVNGRYHLTFHLKNQTERVVTYHFNSSQHWNYILKDAKGHSLFELAKNETYAPGHQELTLKQGEEAAFKATLPPLPKGTYHIKAWLTSIEKGPVIEKNIMI